MRLAIIRQRYNPYGGAERFVERALSALSRSGARVTLICREWSGATPHEVLRCDPFYLGRIWRDAGFARCARRLASAGGFDLVQSHERIPGIAIYRAGDGVHATWLEQRRRAMRPAARAALRLSPYHRYVLAVERRMFQHPALRAVICNSRMVRDDIARRFGVAPAKLHVIYNGVDPLRFHPGLAAEHRGAVRGRWGIPADATLVLCVGSGFERKGVPQLLAAFARARLADARLIIVGADRRLRAMKQRAHELGIGARTHFAGPQAEVAPFYGAADAFVLPTLYDPLPNAALEALACGLPVVTSSASGAAELIEDGRNGYVCDALDVAALADRIERLAVPGASRSMQAQARQSVATLSLDAMAGALSTLYMRLRAIAAI